MTHPTTPAALVAARIRALRRARGWTQAELSKALGNDPMISLGKSQISRIEAGTRQLSIGELSALAAVLTTTPEHLLRPGTICTECGQETTP